MDNLKNVDNLVFSLPSRRFW